MQRYDRQIRVLGIGPTGQRRIAASRVLIVGAGALGTHAAEALVRAGVGTIWLVDRDIVEWTNLQRQVLFDEDDARNGTPKAVAAAARLARINHESHVEPFVAECSAAFLRTLPGRPDLVLDATDNFPTRYLLNDWCHQQQIPWIYAGAVATEGAAMAIVPGRPCLRCLWPEPPLRPTSAPAKPPASWPRRSPPCRRSRRRRRCASSSASCWPKECSPAACGAAATSSWHSPPTGHRLRLLRAGRTSRAADAAGHGHFAVRPRRRTGRSWAATADRPRTVRTTAAGARRRRRAHAPPAALSRRRRAVQRVPRRPCPAVRRARSTARARAA